MSDIFFYGTLRHIPLLKTIIGPSEGTIDLRPAILQDHAVYWVKDQPFPIIERCERAEAKGILASGLSEVDLARLQFYEGGFSYDLVPMVLKLETGESISAKVFFPTPGLWETAEPWSLGDWVAEWGAMSERAAADVMAHFGRLTADEIAVRFDGFRRRAWAWVAAQDHPTKPEWDVERDVIIHAHRRPYANFFAIDEMDIQIRRHDGGLSNVLNREAFLVGQAAVVMPYDPIRDVVLLVEQFRAPVFMSGDRAPWVWEPIAGLIDPGETAEQTAYREAREEAGLNLIDLHTIGQVYSSTGLSSEYIYLFVGIADLIDTVTGAGVVEEGEDIRSEIIPFDTLMRGVDTGCYRDMPLLTTALWLARHRDRLRSEAS